MITDMYKERKKELKVLSLFSGIGAFEKALSNIGVNYSVVGFSEIDKHAITSYCAIHGIDKSLNLGDIARIKTSVVPNADLVTYGFPCQDISAAGRQEGIKEGTRSGLLFQAERIIRAKQPKYAVAENVKNLLSKTHIEDFNSLLQRLKRYGYNSYFAILNAKDYGLPQARERVFIVSIREDVDSKRNNAFKFPEAEILKLSVEDFIDPSVKDRKCKASLKKYYDPKYFKSYQSKHGMIKLFDGVSQGYFKSSYTSNRIYSIKGVCPTLTTVDSNNFYEVFGRLTPKENFRIMGFDDSDYEKIKGVPYTQLQKQIGNSIAVNVLERLLYELLKEEDVFYEKQIKE